MNSNFIFISKYTNKATDASFFDAVPLIENLTLKQELLNEGVLNSFSMARKYAMRTLRNLQYLMVNKR